MAGHAQFSPGAVNYDGHMATKYQSGRALSTEAARVWCAAVAPFIDGARRSRLLDLGSGTGRFARLFAQSFETEVIAIEPSIQMLAAAARGDRYENLAYTAGSAESIPLRDNSCELAWLSHVWHHVHKRHACARELRRVLGPRRVVLLRGTFGDSLDGFPTLFHYWPTARDICQQLPTIAETIAVFATYGFALIERRRIEQRTCATLREFAERTRLRADSALALISDSEFEAGQFALSDSAARESNPSPIIETIDFLVFRSPA